MSHRQNRGMNNVQHKSGADLKEKYIKSVSKKFGGEAEAERITELWEVHRKVENQDDRFEMNKGKQKYAIPQFLGGNVRLMALSEE